VTVRVLYRCEPDGWWADSPDIDGWIVAGDAYEEVRSLVCDGVTFVLASMAEERGDELLESGITDVALKHLVVASF
jgi:predicted RNase H-like HicB family nuclease